MTFFLEALRIALEAIWAAKLRSSFTILGNIVAVTSIIAVVALVRGMDAKVTEAIVSEAGADSFLIERVGVILDDEEEEKARRNNPFITIEDAQSVRSRGRSVAAVMARAQRRGKLSYRERELESVDIHGVTKDYILFRSYDAERGRLFSATEAERRRAVAVLGWDTADRLFGAESPLGKTVKIEGVHFRVVGVSERRGTVLGAPQDEFAVIPLGAFERLYGKRNYGLALMVKPKSPGMQDRAMEEAAVALRVGRRLRPDQENNFGIFSSGTIIGIWRQATEGIVAVLVGVVGLSLVVGGIVIMNIMLMVVTERTPEIGLRKALGARRRDVTVQILIETVTLSTVGGMVGTAFGFAVALLVERLTPVPAAVELWSVALGISMTILVGIVFGLYPAMRAASLDPIEALRRE
ncbi:MAG TPA: ABC transporter permease [Vicinamibacteria bacterium]|nr:ABC transporter permease [Vicinamibacteria bacterium]